MDWLSFGLGVLGVVIVVAGVVWLLDEVLYNQAEAQRARADDVWSPSEMERIERERGN